MATVQVEAFLGLDVASTSVLFLAILSVRVAAAFVATVSPALESCTIMACMGH